MRGWIAAPALVSASLLLAAFEWVWLFARAPVSLGGVLHVVASLAAFLAVAALLLGGLLRLGGLLPRPLTLAPLLLAALPLAVWAGQSFFSGGTARELPGVSILRAGFAVGCLTLLAIGTWGLRELPRRLTGRARSAAAGAAAGTAFALGAIDTHVQVGLYPSAHFLLAATVAALAVLVARLLTPTPPPRAAVAVSLSLLLVALVWTAASWRMPLATGLATASDALLPKLREAAVAVVRIPRALAADDPVLVGDVDPAEFRFVATRAPEIEALRARVRNLVFVLVDALRDDHVGARTDGAPLTPVLDAFAAGGLRFRNTYSGSDQTGRAMPVIMTSYPWPVVKAAVELEVPLASWIDRLRERGFATFANGGSGYVTRKHPHIPVAPSFGAEYAGGGDGRADTLVGEVLEFVAAQGGAPFAVYTHWLDVHVSQFTGDMAGSYRAGVGKVDARMGRLLAGLRETGHGDDTLVVFTSDHGYSLGEDNRFLGAQCCLEREIRVPLLLGVPDGQAGEEIATVVSSVDIVPTLLDVLAPESEALLGGHSLYALAFTDSDPRRLDAHAVFTTNEHLHMVRRGHFKLHWNEDRDTRLVYDLARDPAERQPIHVPLLRDELEVLLAERFARAARLTASLARQVHGDLSGRAVAALLAGDLSVRRVRPLLADFWNESPATRRFILRKVFTGRLGGLRGDLDALARDSFLADDQLLTVARAFTGSVSACDALVDGFAELVLPARRFLAETLDALPDACLASLRGALLEELAALDGESLAAASDDDLYRAVLAVRLAERLGPDTPPGVKRQLRDLYNRATARAPGIRIPVLEGKALSRRSFLRPLEETLREEELALLEDLEPTDHAGRSVARVCLRIGGETGRAFLLRWLEERAGSRAAGAVLEVLQEDPGSGWLEPARSLALRRFPELAHGEG